MFESNAITQDVCLSIRIASSHLHTVPYIASYTGSSRDFGSEPAYVNLKMRCFKSEALTRLSHPNEVSW